MLASIALLLTLWYEATAVAADPIPLRAGPMSMVFEPENAFLRYLKVGSNEVLRGISAPVRNQYWGTVPPQVKIVSLEQKPDHFTLKFDVTCREREIDFLWHGTINGSADGKVEYTFDGEALSDFKRNRIGFCVLHGEAAAGRPWVLETTNGEKMTGGFPEFIAPHQPAKDLKAVSHEFAKDRWARVQFDGDVFEMEDQRNWTDASFKTYCTPLAIPYPVQLTKGDRVRQKVVITLEGDLPRQPEKMKSAEIELAIAQSTTRLPGLGLRMSNEISELTAVEVKRLRDLHLDHLRVDLTPADADISVRWSQAVTQARAVGAKLIVALHLGKQTDTELNRLIAECRSAEVPVIAWLIIGADKVTFDKALAALRPHFPDTWIGVGEDTNFTELNRKRPELKGIDVVSFGMNPQVHAFDNASMIETLPIQAETVRSARQFLGKLPVIISPITLRVQQLNEQPLAGELPANVDPRQPTLFAAAWTVGSIKYLAEADVNRFTYFETVGSRGIMSESQPSFSREKFPAVAEQIYPIYEVLRAVGEFNGGEVRHVSSSHPGEIVGLMLSRDRHQRILVTNLSGDSRRARIKGLDSKFRGSLLRADSASTTETEKTTWEELRDLPADPTISLALPPYGVARLDSSSD